MWTLIIWRILSGFLIVNPETQWNNSDSIGRDRKHGKRARLAMGQSRNFKTRQ